MTVPVISSPAQRMRGAQIDRHGQVGLLRHCLTTAVEISGRLPLDCLQEAVDWVVRRHPALRSVFRARWDHHIVLAGMRVTVARTLVTGPPQHRWQEAVDFAYQDRMRPFDLVDGPLMRATVLSTAPDRHLLVLSFDQMVIDAQSAVIVVQELVESAHQLVTGDSLPPPGTDDYVELRQCNDEWLSSPAGAKAVARRQAALTDASLDLPWPAEADPVGPDELAHRTVSLSDDVTETLFARTKEARVVPFAPALAALALMTTSAGGDRQVITSMFAARVTGPEMEVVGWLSNRTAVVTPSWTGSVLDCVRLTHREVMTALDNQRVPFDPPANALTASLLYLPAQLAGGRQEGMRIGEATTRRLAVSFCPTGADIDFFVAEDVLRLTGERPRLTVGATSARARVGQAQLDDLVERWAAALAVLASVDWAHCPAPAAVEAYRQRVSDPAVSSS